jgi:tRNA modification GTPase
VLNTDTIVAQASPPGKGGVSIIRISGRDSLDIAKKLFRKETISFKDKEVLFVNCFSEDKKLIDQGISLYFKSPKSFTGEDVIEFQCHGSPIVVDLVLTAAIKLGARLARPGEFSERAFLNGKIDLVQAEAIADLIDSQSKQAAKNAVQTLKGAFSEKINELTQELIKLRIYLEASIDFPDEESVDFISEGKIKEKTAALIQKIIKIKKQAEQGQIIQEGLCVVLAGEPNAGKSSLLNALTQKESAIVTEIPGTTRDVLREQILVNNIPIKIIDTAGLRQSDDLVEKEGIRRAWQEIETADLVLYLVDTQQAKTINNQSAWKTLQNRISEQTILIIENKIDLNNKKAELTNIIFEQKHYTQISLSAKHGTGIDILKNKISEIAGVSQNQEGMFTARRRHLNAIDLAEHYCSKAHHLLEEETSPELVAEDLRLAQLALGEITGEFSADDLLGEIFSSFCIGK